MYSRITLLLLPFAFVGSSLFAEETQLTIKGEHIFFAGRPTKLIGLRCSNALISDGSTQNLIDALDIYCSYGLNSVSVFVMGSRFGDVKGYLPDGSLSPEHTVRLERILRATEARKMITIVGCLYWGTSRAKEDLTHWKQQDANRAIANTVHWLREKGFRHVILDPDNEGMAVRANKWRITPMILAANEADPDIVVANNTRQKTDAEDLNMHFGPREPGKPWLDSESTPKISPLGAYWSRYSKETHEKNSQFDNYSRIGRYTREMKANQIALTKELLAEHSGILLAGTWLQCAPIDGKGGPFTKPGGLSELGSGKNANAQWNQDIDVLHPDAGIRWWVEFVRQETQAKK